jgi:hypothetical protein
MEKYLIILPSGNTLADTEEGKMEVKYLSRVTRRLKRNCNVVFIKYPKRKTHNYSSTYFISKSVLELKRLITEIGADKEVIIDLLGISVGAIVGFKYMKTKSGIGINKFISVGNFIYNTVHITNDCREIWLLYGNDDIISINSKEQTTSLYPIDYSSFCKDNLKLKNNNAGVSLLILKNRNHTLLYSNNIKNVEMTASVIIDILNKR